MLMIHEFREEMLKLPLEDYTLTFDDGLFSQYYYFDQIKHLDTDKIFFISTNIVCSGQQSMEFPDCRTAHKKAFSDNLEDYMTLDQIKYLQSQPRVRIGGHSHYHENISDLKMFDRVKHIESDTDEMLMWFYRHMHFKPVDFCFPYNQDLHGIYRLILTKHGFTNFYGSERIAIESLL